MIGGQISSDEIVGRVFGGRYRADALIGHGGMAKVYRATDDVLHRGVALKLFAETGDDAHTARAATEVRLLAALNHPSLVTLYDADVATDRDPYLVMELIDGPTLRDRIADGSIENVDVAAMALDLAEALHAVHSAGMVHRDLKPSNVLLAPSVSPTREFRAKLADFGIAHLVDSARTTTPGTIMGTAAYLSPEQTRGVTPAPAGDVYSLGLVLLESLTRTRAFPGSMAESLAARVQRDPDVPGEIGYAWRSLLSAMTARLPADRPSALEVADAARTILRDEGTGPLLPADTVAVSVSTTTTATARLERRSTDGTLVPAWVAPVSEEESELTAALRMPPTADTETDTEPSLLGGAPRARRGAVGLAPSRSPKRRAVGVAAGVALVVGLGVGAASWLGGSASPSGRSVADADGMLGLRTAVDELSTGVIALVAERRQGVPVRAVETPTTESAITGDDGSDTVVEPPTDDGSETAPAGEQPVETEPIDASTPPDESPVTENPAIEAPTTDVPPGNGNGAGNGNGNGAGNGAGNGNGNGNGKGAGTGNNGGG